MHVYIESLFIDYDLAQYIKKNNKFVGYDKLDSIVGLYEKIKTMDYGIDNKTWDMLYISKTIGQIKIQEVNQDDIYEIFVRYDSVFKLKTEDDKIRLKYLKYDLIYLLFEVFINMTIRFNREKFENNMLSTLKDNSPIDYLRVMIAYNQELSDFTHYENSIKLWDEIGIPKTNEIYSNIIINCIRFGVNSKKIVFKNKAAIILKNRIAYIRPIAKGKDMLMIELTGLYQFLLQKLKLEGDKITYKKCSEEAIKLLTMHFPKNPDILTTYLTDVEIYVEQSDYEHAYKIAKEAVAYTKKYFDLNSIEVVNSLSTLCNLLYMYK